MIYSHVCPHCERVTVTNKKYFACGCVERSVRPKSPTVWDALHRYAIDNWADWSPVDAASFYADWLPTIPTFGCDCVTTWVNYTAAHPPDFDSPAGFFRWSIAAHNHVSTEHAQPRKPAIALAQAYGLYRRSGSYDTQPPTDPPRVDVVIPFCAGDRHFLPDAVSAIASQRHVRPVIHCIADGCDFPELALPCHRYSTPGGWGPYRITNSLVHHGHCQTDVLAIQDVDDISLPDRLWRQLATMHRWGYQHVGGSMVQQPADGYTEDRHIREPILRPWRVYRSCPNGHLINSTRTITLSAFRALNGFRDLMCGADNELDNRVGLLPPHESIPSFGARDIDGIRRLHHNSLTNGKTYGYDSPARVKSNAAVVDLLQQMQVSPSLATARRIGQLDSAPPLTILR